MIRPRHATVALLATGLLLTGGAASAAQKSAKDHSGDVAPVADITRVVVKNSAKTLAVKVKLMKASAGRSHVVVTLTPTAEGAASYVARTVEAGEGKKIGATLESTVAGATEATAVDCTGIKASVSSGKRGQVSVRIPQSCFGEDAGTLVAEVATETGAGDVVDEAASLRVKQG